MKEIYIPSDTVEYAGETICLLYETLYQLAHREDYETNIPVDLQGDVDILVDKLSKLIYRRKTAKLPVPPSSSDEA